MTEQTTSISITENNSVKKVILQKSPLPFQQNPNQGDKVSCKKKTLIKSSFLHDKFPLQFREQSYSPCKNQ